MSNEERASYEVAISKIRDAEREICEVVLERMRRERRNFEHLAAQLPYSDDPLHKTAVAQYSFEELVEAVRYLSHVLEFRDQAIELAFLAYQELIRPIDEREGGRILAVIKLLEPRLQKRILT